MHFASQTDGSDPSAVLESISQHARVLMRGTGAAIALAHKEYMIYRASVGNAPTLGARLDVSSGLSGECIRTGKTVLCDNSDSDPRVDAKNCRRLGIHSILATPIRLGVEVVGILEVFSSQRFNFHEGDVAVVEHLAQGVWVVPPSAETTRTVQTTPVVQSTPTVQTPTVARATPAPNLLLELEPAGRVFFGNLIDLLFPPRSEPLKLTSRPSFWPDVLVSSPLPWDRFVQSMLLHMIMIAVLGAVESGLSQRPRLRQNQMAFNKSDVIYYLPPEYMESLRRETERSPSQQRPKGVKQPFISVHRESASRRRKSITPPALHLKQDSRFSMMAWNPTSPTVPFSATMRSQRTAPATGVAVVAPPPDVVAVSRAQHLTLATPQVIQPAPSVDESVRQKASISLGHTEVVRPAPEIHELGSLTSTAQATLGKASTSVVPPPPSVHQPIHPMESLSLGRLQVVGPAPEITLQGQRSLSTTIQATLGRAATPVVPPAPSVGGIGNSGQRTGSRPSADTHAVPPPPALLQIAGSYLIDTPDGGAILVVPPAPSIGSLEHRSGHSASSVGSGGAQAVVPPPPSLQGTGAPGRGKGNGMAMAGVPPPPSVGGLGRSGGQSASSLAGGGVQAVVPPPPRLQNAGASGRGTGNGMAVAVVPPPPSVGGLGRSGGRSSSSQRAAGMQMAQPKIAISTGGGESTQAQKSTAGASGPPGGKLPGEITGNTGEAHPDSKKAIAAIAAPAYDCWGYGCTSADKRGSTKHLSISFIGPALAFPQSSYSSNFEVFIAEERLGRHQSRVIKLVYDFLPHQPRLSVLGPDYPVLENLHATRDPSCDEPLKQVVSLASALQWPQASLAQLSATSAKQRLSTLPCYRTTAGDYRKALAREHRVEDK
jgi:GAF domain